MKYSIDSGQNGLITEVQRTYLLLINSLIFRIQFQPLHPTSEIQHLIVFDIFLQQFKHTKINTFSLKKQEGK